MTHSIRPTTEHDLVRHSTTLNTDRYSTLVWNTAHTVHHNTMQYYTNQYNTLRLGIMLPVLGLAHLLFSCCLRGNRNSSTCTDWGAFEVVPPPPRD